MKEKNITTTTIEKKRKKENMCQLQTNISEVYEIERSSMK